MNVQDIVLDSILRSTADVFSTMMGIQVGAGVTAIEHGVPEANDGVVSFIGVAGAAWAGTGTVTCSPALACRICSLMLMNEVAAVDEEVLDAVAELTNMIVGSVKNDLEAHIGPLGLSIPTVVYGRNFKTKSAGSADWMVVRFPCEGGTLIVKVFLAPTEKHHHVSRLAGEAVAVDVP
jgi:chemotaxis protein CheX